MTVKRIVANIATPDPLAARAFYEDVLGLVIVMDHGWIVTFGTEPTETRPQVSMAREGGSGTPVPAISVEVDDVDAVYERARDGGFEVVYGMAEEPWGVRRFFVRDPVGTIVNVLQHLDR